MINIKQRKLKIYGHINWKGNILTTALGGKLKANDQKADLETPSLLLSKNGQNLKGGNAIGWLQIGTCEVSSHVNLRREDDISR